jgi:hypothetical protein
MASFAPAADLRITVDSERLSGPGYLDGDRHALQSEMSGSRTEATPALTRQLGDMLPILLWIVLLLHPALLIALSFHWGLL